MAEPDNDAPKTEAPTQRRLDEARRKGDVARSPDVPQVAALAAAGTVVLMSGGPIARAMAAALQPFLERPDAFALSGGDGAMVLRQALTAAAPAGAVMAAAMAAGAAGNVLQQGLLWTPSRLAPAASKVSPRAGLKRLFGPDGLAHFVKSLLKLIAVGVAAWLAVKPRMADLQEAMGLPPAALLQLAMALLAPLLVNVVVATGAIAAADWFWQRFRFMQRLRMSREDLKQDARDTEGDPQLKAKLRQNRVARSKKRMIQAVPKATLVVMNPTHYAVALRYVQGETPAPVCVAKGVDALALRIRAVAEEHGVAVLEDAPLARALFSAMEVDEAIPREHYQAVARLVGFVMGKKARRAPPPRRGGRDVDARSGRP